mmetsp:Transcript_38584/g.90181  ORF Transcript_38584/g.90181 Transcript_38584/m.90181 type:complete len:249 (+) Transcript_38584:569-1315(+)
MSASRTQAPTSVAIILSAPTLKAHFRVSARMGSQASPERIVSPHRRQLCSCTMTTTGQVAVAQRRKSIAQGSTPQRTVGEIGTHAPSSKAEIFLLCATVERMRTATLLTPMPAAFGRLVVKDSFLRLHLQPELSPLQLSNMRLLSTEPPSSESTAKTCRVLRVRPTLQSASRFSRATSSNSSNRVAFHASVLRASNQHPEHRQRGRRMENKAPPFFFQESDGEGAASALLTSCSFHHVVLFQYPTEWH